MCGIVGYVGPREAGPVLIGGLRKLEYRGYDSAGVAVFTNDHIEVRRSVGKLDNLETLLAKQPIGGTPGIGHTRWATHGRPTEENAAIRRRKWVPETSDARALALRATAVHFATPCFVRNSASAPLNSFGFSMNRKCPTPSNSR